MELGESLDRILDNLPALPDRVRALEAVQLLSSTASPVGVVRVLALTGTA